MAHDEVAQKNSMKKLRFRLLHNDRNEKCNEDQLEVDTQEIRQKGEYFAVERQR